MRMFCLRLLPARKKEARKSGIGMTGRNARYTSVLVNSCMTRKDRHFNMMRLGSTFAVRQQEKALLRMLTSEA